MSVKKTTEKKSTEKKTTKSTAKKTTSVDSNTSSGVSQKEPIKEGVESAEPIKSEVKSVEPAKAEVKTEVKPVAAAPAPKPAEPVKAEVKTEVKPVTAAPAPKPAEPVKAEVKTEVKPVAAAPAPKPAEPVKAEIKIEPPVTEPEKSEEVPIEEDNKKKKKKDKEKKPQPEIVGKLKSGFEKIPTGLHETENKLKLTTSKLFALTGSLFAIFEGRQLLLWSFNAMYVVAGIISVIAGFFIFITLNIVDFGKILKKKMPYEWFILMGIGFLVFLLNRIASSIGWIKGGVLMMIGGLILLMQSDVMPPKLKLLKENQLICLIGIGIGVYEGIMLIANYGGNVWQIITGLVVIAFMALLFISLGLIPIKLPPALQFSWWGVLTIGIAMWYLSYQLSAIVILHVFLLILISL